MVVVLVESGKTLLRHYAKQALTPRSLNVKLGPRHKSHSRGLLRDCTTGCGTDGSFYSTISDDSQHSSIFNYFPGDKTTWEGEDSGFCFDPGDCDCRTDTPTGPYPPPTVSFQIKLLMI